MSILNFPSSPNVGDVYTFNGKTWRWNGTAWKSYNALGIAQGGTGLTGIDTGNTFLSANSSGTALTYRTFIAGSGILITVNPNNVVFTSTATGGGGGGTGGSGVVDYGLLNSVAYYPAAGTLVTGTSNFTYNAASSDTLTLGGMTFVGSGNNSIQITNVGNGGQILSTWNTLNSGLALDATNASLRIVGDTNAGTTLVDLGVYSNSGFPVGSWTSKYLFPKTSEAIFVNGLNIQDTTNTTNPSVGALKVAGGLGISGSASIGQSLVFYNSSNSNYIAFKSGASSASTTYILPLTSPATGTSVLQSDTSGNLSWVPMVASGSGNVGQGNQYQLGWYDTTGTAITGSGSGLTWNNNTSLLSIYGNDAKLAIGITSVVNEKKIGLLLENTSKPQLIDTFGLYTPSLVFRGFGNSDDGVTTFSSEFGIEVLSAEGYNIARQNSLTLYSTIDGSRNDFINLSDLDGSYEIDVYQSTSFTDGINVTNAAFFNNDVYAEESIYFGPPIFPGGGQAYRTRLLQHPSVGFGITYVFPRNAPSGFNFLTSSTGGTLSWVAFGGTVHSSNINTIPYYVTSGNAITGSPDFINSGTGISIRYTTASTSSNTGALIVSGGVGIGGSFNISNNINIRSGNELRVFEPGNTNYFGLKYTGATQKTYTFPADTPGTGTSVLQSDTSGNLSWVPMVASGSGSGGSGTVNDGLVNQLAFYPSTGTAVTGAIGLTYSSTTNLLTAGTFAGNLSATAATATDFYGNLTGFATTGRNLVTLSNTTSTTDHYILFSLRNGGSGIAVSSGLGISYNPASSTLRVGGVGISGTQFTTSATTFNLFNTAVTTFNGLQVGTAISIGAATGTFTVNNATLRANQSTASINSTSGSIIAAGGVGIGGSLNVAGTASNISNLLINNSVITSGSWAGSTITSRYGGTGLSSYTKGDLLVGLGNTLIPLSVGTNNFVLKADNTTTSGLTWGLVDNNSLVNSTFYIGSASTSIGSTIGIVAGAGISFLYSNHSITIYNRSGVLITSTYPVSALQGDLFWHDEEGVLKIYYDDTDGPGQWVDANQRWGQGQYVTFPDLGAGDLYEVAYYSGAGHSVNGANNFTNNTSTQQVAITYGTGNTSKSTGALVVSGGVGIGGSLYANTVVSSTGFIENVYAGGTAGTGSTIYPNWNDGSVQTYTIAGNCWLGLPTNMPTGASLTLVISQNATGGWAMTSDTNIKYAGGSKTISTGANAIDVINMFYTGSTYLAALTTGYS